MKVVIKVLIDNPACRYMLSRAGCGRIRHLSTRVLWVQQRVEQKELRVTPVSSTDNLADIGTKKLPVRTMRDIGIYDSEKGQLVGQDEHEQKLCKQNLRLITGSSNFKTNAKAIQLIIASSFSSTDAWSCLDPMVPYSGNFTVMEQVADAYLWFSGVIYPYLAEYQSVVEYAQIWMNGFAYLVGWLCITTFMICLVCRVYFGPDAISSTPGRVFALFGELVECMAHHFLEWYGERKIKYWHGDREKCFAKKDKPSIMYAQEMAISWRKYLRFFQGIVYNFFDEIQVESPGDRYIRCQCSSMSECSSPTYWQKVHHGTSRDLSDEDFVADYVTARESILHRAGEARDEAEMYGDHERMYHYENIIDAITPL